MLDFLYHYRGIVTRTIDGDTVVASIDLGLHTWIHDEHLRLARINAPEIRGESRMRGLAAREYLSDMVTGKEVYIHTVKDEKEKWGRYKADIYVQIDDKWANVNDALVMAGHAVWYMVDD